MRTMTNRKRTIVVGGVAGGMSAATRLRRLDEHREILVLEKGPHVSFANCGLPYHVGGTIADRSSLLLHTPESLTRRFRLDVRVGHEVVAVDPGARTVEVRELATGRTLTEPYDELVLATGAGAGVGPTAGAVPTHTLRTVEDVDRVNEVLAGLDHTARVVVVGAGFIGLEAVENLLARGAEVTLVQRGPQALSPLDPEMAMPVHQALVAAGVDIRCGTTVVGAEDDHVLLSDGSRVRADLVVQASGVQPQTGLAVSAGLELGPTGGIAVDARQRTSVPGIWAVGDGVEKVDHLSGTPTLVTMAGLANRHGRAAADDIAGLPVDEAAPALGTAIVGLLGLTAALVGWNEKRVVAAGLPHRIVHLHPASHAGYYPGAERMAIKLVVAEDDRILGAQIVGGEGVDKRIDVIAVAMAAGMSASSLSRLELAYAPQFGSAKDPVNMAGYIAENVKNGVTRTLQWHELDQAVADGATVVDVRSPQEHAAGCIPGSVLLPLDELRDRHLELPAGPLVVHCQVGQRGHLAARTLSQLGHDVRNLDGGWLTWSAGTASRATARPGAGR